MKKELLTMLASSALFAYSANAEIVLTEDLSVSGYIDAAITDSEGEANTATSVAEFELGFSFTPAESPWSAVAELSFDDSVNSGNNPAEFEKVMLTYAYSDSLSFTTGKMLTYMGFEAADATGLYQFSYQGIGGGAAHYAGYGPGASVDYASGDYEVGVWAGRVNDATTSMEYYVGYKGIEDLTVKVIFCDDPTYEIFNTWASYDYGDFTFAAEYTARDNEASETTDSEVYMALVYYSMGDAGLTLRYSGGEYVGADFDRITISPSYAFSDNVFGLVEYSVDDLDAGGTDTQLAAELIFSF